MSDVFISYARSTEAHAERMSDALRALGYEVWRDDQLPAHLAYADVIEARLHQAKAVVVIWSADALQSEWVRSEADRARNLHKLVQLSFDGVRLPMPFDQIQCADLAGWDGASEHKGFRKVADSVADLVAGRAAPLRVWESAAALAPAAAPAQPLLAVLAFDNLSGDADMDFFSDGVAEEIHQNLARSRELKVIARSSSFQFRGADKAVRQVASQLAVSHVLDGSVRRAGQRVRVSSQLIDCGNEVTLWSERFDRDLTDIFAVQDEIASDVAKALHVALSPKARAQGAPIDPAVYDSFLRAQALLFGADRGKLTPAEAVGSAITLLEDVAVKAPAFARGWGQLAWARSADLRAGRSARPYREARADVVTAGEMALRLDPARSEAAVALSNLEPWGAFLAREAPLLKQLELTRNDPILLQYLGNFYSNLGIRQHALNFASQARTLDPMLPVAQGGYASLLMDMGHTDAGWSIYEEVCHRWPQFVAEAVMWSAALHDWDRFDRYVAEGAKGPAVKVPLFGALVMYGRQLRTPNPALAQAYLAAIRAQFEDTGRLQLDGFCTLDDFGLTDEAFEMAGEASFAHMFEPEGQHPGGGYAVAILFSRHNGRRLKDPRFVALCAKLGMCDYWVKADKWPDCAAEAPYDFKAEARRLVGEAEAAVSAR
jgi:TolB-like protein